MLGKQTTTRTLVPLMPKPATLSSFLHVRPVFTTSAAFCSPRQSENRSHTHGFADATLPAAAVTKETILTLHVA